MTKQELAKKLIEGFIVKIKQDRATLKKEDFIVYLDMSQKQHNRIGVYAIMHYSDGTAIGNSVDMLFKDYDSLYMARCSELLSECYKEYYGRIEEFSEVI